MNKLVSIILDPTATFIAKAAVKSFEIIAIAILIAKLVGKL